MTQTTDNDRDSVGSNHSGTGANTSDAVAWFVREVLPFGAILMHFLRHNWRGASDIEDLR